MRKVSGSVLLAALIVAGLAQRVAVAKEKKASMSESRWRGVIVRSNKDVMTLTVRKGNIEKIIHYDTSTKWTQGTKEIDSKEFKDGSRVICLGKYNDKSEFMATRIDLRGPGAGLFH